MSPSVYTTNNAFIINCETLTGKTGVDYDFTNHLGVYMVAGYTFTLPDAKHSNPITEFSEKSWYMIKLGSHIAYASAWGDKLPDGTPVVLLFLSKKDLSRPTTIPS